MYILTSSPIIENEKEYEVVHIIIPPAYEVCNGGI